MAHEQNRGELTDKVIKIKRCAAVVKGGRRFSFAAMVVVGNGRGKSAGATAKPTKSRPAWKKRSRTPAVACSKFRWSTAPLPHAIKGQFGAANVVLLPASPGTGVIAGAAVRAVCEVAGIHDVLTKCYGSTNPVNLVKATVDALKQLRTRQEVERLRGVSLA